MGLLAEGGLGLPTAAACQYVLRAGWPVARLGLGLAPLTLCTDLGLATRFEKFRVFEAKRSETRSVNQDAAVQVTHEADDAAIRLAVAETRIEALHAMVQELRQSRDHWQAQAERLALAAPIAPPPPASAAPTPENSAELRSAAEPNRRSWWRRLAG